MTPRLTPLRVPLKLLALLLAIPIAGLSLAPAAAQAPDQKLNTATSGNGSERFKAVPIGRKAGSKLRSVMSIPGARVGPVKPGDTVVSSGDIEVSTTCLEPMPQCVGRPYTYSPFVRGRTVLAKSSKATRKGTFALSGWQKLKCAQDLPNRNHHCVLVIPKAIRTIPNGANLPCNHCNVNFVLDAYSGQAKSGHKLVLGADGDHGVSQDKGRVNAAVFHPGPRPDVQPLRSVRPQNARIPVSNSLKKKVIYSLRVPKLRKGEQLIVDAKAVASLGGKNYNALIQSQLILSEGPNSTKRAGVPPKVATNGGEITDNNGFNCTRGHSAHDSPCTIRRPGVIAISRDARSKPLRDAGRRVPLYINLIAASKAVYGGNPRPGDALKVKKKAGYIEAFRYGPQFR